MYIHIDNDGKINDICSRLDGGHKYSEDFLDEDYIQTNDNDIRIEDTWDFENNISLKDSPQRFIEPEPTELEILKEKYDKLENRIQQLESK